MWLREPHTISQDFSESEINEIDGGSRQFETDQEGVWIHLRVQTIGSRRHVTCRLVNKKELSDDADQQERGESTIFQCQIKLESPEFLDARWQSDLETDPTTAILYHDSKVYSRGHNISVDWSELTTTGATPVPEVVTPAPAAPVTTDRVSNLMGLSKAALVAQAGGMGMATSGTKTVLATRIDEGLTALGL